MMDKGGCSRDMIGVISCPLLRSSTLPQTTNMMVWISHSDCSKLVILLMLITEALSNDGICTRSEVVSKTRPIKRYERYSVSYLDRCYNGWRYYTCTQWREEGRYIDDKESYTELESRQFCCTGYEEKTEGCGNNQCTLECEPICDFSCLNGKCTAPNQCECDHGYTKTAGTENICEPVCTQVCIHGYCSKPEYCGCDVGYEHTSPYVCEAVCSTPCINADCTLPDVCTCFLNYTKTIGDPHRCHAQCSPPCHNGVCTSPNQCTCFEGYERDNSTWNVCNPVCSKGCINGTCIAPDICQCFDGFAIGDNEYTCEPVCSDCLNAFCSAPDVCSCLSGYEKDVNDFSTCLPVCSPECVNGNCTSPDRCECFDGFEENDNSTFCRPYCSNECENGICTAPEVCTCLWGFYSEGNSSNCSKQADEYHDCSFVNHIANHDFNRHCFTVNDELALEELKNCKILQNLLSKLVENTKTGIIIDLQCKNVSDLKVVKSKLSLEFTCEVTLNHKEQSLGDENFSTTAGYSEGKYSSNSSEYSSTEMYSLDLFLIEDQSISGSSEENKNETGAGDNSNNNPINEEYKKFMIHFDKIYPNITTQLYGFPLDLNINLKFFPLIRSSQITQQYFDNITDLKQEWCFCHKNKGNWSICANSPVPLHFCPCDTTRLKIQGQGQDSSHLSAVRIVMLAALTMLLAACVVLFAIHYMRQSGTYNAAN